MKHTKGPWNFSRMGDAGWILAGKTYIAEIITADEEDCYVKGMEEQDANAKLMTAAPELLEALKELKKQIFAHHKMNVKKDFSLLLADVAASKAIAKAEGN